MKSLWSLRGVMSYLLIFLLFLCCNLPICLNISGLFNYYFSEWSPMWLIEKKTDLFGLRLLVLLLLFPPPHCPSVYPHFQLTYPPFVISSSLPIIPSWRQRLSILPPDSAHPLYHTEAASASPSSGTNHSIESSLVASKKKNQKHLNWRESVLSSWL